MKIGIVCLNLSFVAGGARLVLELARSLSVLGNKVIVYAPDFDAEHYKGIAQGIDIQIVKLRAPLIWTGSPRNFFQWIWRKIQKESRFVLASRRIARAMDGDFDIVNVHDFAYRVGYFYKKRNPKAQVIWTENAPPFMYVPKGSFLRDILGRWHQRVEELSNSKYFRSINKVAVLDFLNQKWCEDRGLKNIRVIRCGVDFEKFYSPVKDFTKRAREKKAVLFSLGALNPYRRYDIVIRSVKILRDSGIDARALIDANNIWNEDGVRGDLLRLVKENKLESFIDLRFAGMTEEELRVAYRESDFFVQAVYVPPPGNHGWGIVNFEGMSAGLPVILCRTATATEVLKDGESAFFMDPLKPEHIAEKVMLCVKRPDIYSKVAQSGQEIARQMTWRKYSEETLKLFQI